MLRFTLSVVAGLLLFAGAALASVINVAPNDVTVNDATHCSLLDAINAANASVSSNVTVGACTPVGSANGGGTVYGVTYASGNIVVLGAGAYTLTAVYAPPASYPNAIKYADAADGYWYGPDGLPPIATNITIAGDPAGSTIERSGAPGTPSFRLFYVGGGQSLAGYNPPAGLTKLPGPGNLTLINLTLKNGLAQGGNGANPFTDGAGGGGLGAGGAVYNQGNLTLTGVTLVGNTAVGGNGTNKDVSGGSGSGGGMGGNALSEDGAGFTDSVWPDSSATAGTFGNGGHGNGGHTGVGGAGGVGGGGGGAGGANNNGGAGGFGGGGGGAGGPGGSKDVGGTGGFGGGGGSGSGAAGFGGGAGGPVNPDGTPIGIGGGGAGNWSPGGGAGLGGAIFNEGGVVAVTNSTFTGNSARGGPTTSTGAGGSAYAAGVFNLNGTVTIQFSTFADNSVSAGSGSASGLVAGDDVYNLYVAKSGSPAADAGSAAKMTVQSSILAGPLSSAPSVSDCENNGGAFTSGYDLVQTPGTTCSFSNNDQTAAPQLSALAANGGPTQTLAIAATSPAANHANPVGAPATDQRGYVRDSQPDVGAFEYGAMPAALSVTAPANITMTAGSVASAQSFSLKYGGPGLVTVTAVSSNTALLPASGIVVSPGCGSDPSHYSCTVTLTPASNQTGSTAVGLIATNQFGGYAQAGFVLTVNTSSSATVAPVANNLSLSAIAGEMVTSQLSAIYPNGDALSYTASAAAHGTLTLTDAATGAFTYAPNSGYTGSDSFTYSVKDMVTGLMSSSATVSVTVNAGPTSQSPPPTGGGSSGGSGGSSSSSGKGGGGIGILSLLLLAPLIWIRKQRR